MSCCTIVLACLFSVYPFPVLPKELHYFFNILPEDSCIRLLHYAQFCVFTLIYLMPSSVVISTNLLRFKYISRIENQNIFWYICSINFIIQKIGYILSPFLYFDQRTKTYYIWRMNTNDRFLIKIKKHLWNSSYSLQNKLKYVFIICQ